MCFSFKWAITVIIPSLQLFRVPTVPWPWPHRAVTVLCRDRDRAVTVTVSVSFERVRVPRAFKQWTKDNIGPWLLGMEEKERIHNINFQINKRLRLGEINKQLQYKFKFTRQKLKTAQIPNELVKSCPARYYFLMNRVAPIWNSLPYYVVNAKTINEFKNKLDEWNFKRQMH